MVTPTNAEQVVDSATFEELAWAAAEVTDAIETDGGSVGAYSEAAQVPADEYQAWFYNTSGAVLASLVRVALDAA